MIAMLCLIAASGFFSASETALFYLSHDELRSMRSGRTAERAVASLLSDPDRLLTAVLFWNLVTNLTYFAVSIVVAHKLHAEGYSAVAGVASLLSLALIILCGEVLPKSIAVAMRRRLATVVVWPLSAAVRVLDPVIPILSWVSLLVRRTFWPHVQREPFLQPDHLEQAIENSELSDEVIRHERQALHNILDLSEIKVEEVMRPRGTYLSLPPPVHLEHLGGNVPPSGYVVVQANGNEEIIGVIPLAALPEIPERHLEASAEDVVYVPWCASLASVLQSLRDRFLSVAAVVNEYGETIGIVTYEDIIDTVFMPEPSRARRLLQREPVEEVAPGCYQVEGITTLRYLCRRLGLPYEPTADGQVTVAGMLHEELEHLPRVGDTCTWRGYEFRVVDVRGRSQLQVLVTKVPQQEPVGGQS